MSFRNKPLDPHNFPSATDAHPANDDSGKEQVTNNNKLDNGVACQCCGFPSLLSPLLSPVLGIDDTSSLPNTHGIPANEFKRLCVLANSRAARLVSSAKMQIGNDVDRDSRGVDRLLAYNELWAKATARKDPTYFPRLVAQQKPEHFYIGCSDSRVPANEIMGLVPGEVFVHRNVANVVSPSDLNMLATLQYAVDHLKVEHVIISGHYRCGGVTAALKGLRLGLVDHWVSHVVDVKRRHWKRLQADVLPEDHLDALCELNVLGQISHLVDTHVVQRVWERQNGEEQAGGPASASQPEITVHGWVFSIGDGIIRPLVRLNRHDDSAVVIQEAEDAVFVKYAKGRAVHCPPPHES